MYLIYFFIFYTSLILFSKYYQRNNCFLIDNEFSEKEILYILKEDIKQAIITSLKTIEDEKALILRDDAQIAFGLNQSMRNGHDYNTLQENLNL